MGKTEWEKQNGKYRMGKTEWGKGGSYNGETDAIEELNVTDGSWSISNIKMPFTNLYDHTALYLNISQD